MKNEDKYTINLSNGDVVKGIDPENLSPKVFVEWRKDLQNMQIQMNTRKIKSTGDMSMNMDIKLDIEYVDGLVEMIVKADGTELKSKLLDYCYTLTIKDFRAINDLCQNIINSANFI